MQTSHQPPIFFLSFRQVSIWTYNNTSTVRIHKICNIITIYFFIIYNVNIHNIIYVIFIKIHYSLHYVSTFKSHI